MRQVQHGLERQKIQMLVLDSDSYICGGETGAK